MNDMTYIRCFDLGGGGLKTGLLSYNKTTGEMKIEQDEIKLGKCGTTEKVQDWVRNQMRANGIDLDREIANGNLFGFSLAGLEKLFENKKIESSNLPQLFNLPSEKVSSISDGRAHTLASVRMLKQQLATGEVWNFSIGTGVGMGYTDIEKNLHTNAELKEFFDGKNSWDVKEPTTNKAVWESCSSKRGFDKIVADITHTPNDEAFKIFATRWKAFIEQRIIDNAQKKGKPIPTAVVFTGGNIDWYGDKLATAVNNLGLKIKAFTGPKHAALYGAAFNAIDREGGQKTELSLKFPENKHDLYRDLGLEPQQVEQLKEFLMRNHAKSQGTGKKYSEGEYDGIWLPRPVEYHKDGRVTIELKGGEAGCTFTPGELFDPIAGKKLSKEEKLSELKFPKEYYKELGLETKQINQLKESIEKNYATLRGTGKKFLKGQQPDKTWLPRDVEYRKDGTVTIKLEGAKEKSAFKDGDLYDPINGKKI